MRGGIPTSMEVPIMKAFSNVFENGINAHKHTAAASIPLAARPAAGIEESAPLTRLPLNTRVTRPEPEPARGADREDRRSTDHAMYEEQPTRITESAVQRTVADTLPYCGDIDGVFEREGYSMGYCDAEYVHEIHAYLLHQEKNMRLINPFSSTGVRTSVDTRSRAKLIDWLSGMHYTFRLAIESLFLAIQMVDRFFSLRISRLSRNKLELLGITVLFTASKFEESYTPSMKHFLASVKNKYSSSQVSGLEFEILEALGFNLSFPTAIIFIRRYAAVLGMTSRDRYRAFCLSELCLHNEDFITVPPSVLASAAIITSYQIAGFPAEAQWPNSLEVYSSHTAADLAETVDRILDIAAECDGDIYRYSITKYSKPQYYDVGSELLEYADMVRHL